MSSILSSGPSHRLAGHAPFGAFESYLLRIRFARGLPPSALSALPTSAGRAPQSCLVHKAAHPHVVDDAERQEREQYR